MKNRMSVYFALGIIVLAAIGIIGMLMANPAGFIQRIAVLILIGVIIYFTVKRFYKGNPQKKEQRAFIKAAKESKKRLFKNSESSQKSSLTSLKKSGKTKRKTPVHLTVIEGKKAKKKNRASF